MLSGFIEACQTLVFHTLKQHELQDATVQNHWFKMFDTNKAKAYVVAGTNKWYIVPLSGAHDYFKYPGDQVYMPFAVDVVRYDTIGQESL